MVFKNIIVSILTGKEIVLLDSDLSQDEISRLGITQIMLDETYDIEITNIEIDVNNRLPEEFRLTLFTSGTTGRPKKISHSYSSLTRGVKKGDRFKDNIWGFAYNPTHFAGMQVFFQAYLNKNPVINLFDLDKNLIPKEIQKNAITNISATPTFFRTILPFVDEPLNSVSRITTGGEKFDSTLVAQLGSKFPKAKIRNIYASTEADTLFAAKGDVFTVKENIKDKIKFTDEGELLVHISFLGNSETFQLIDDEWYKTGDLVEFIDEEKTHFKFLSRKSEMINIGGYKVNPNEIEDLIKQYDGVIDVLISARKNRITGNILQAEIKVEENKSVEEKELIEYLIEHLQEWKIPRIIRFVDDIKLTRTGKKVRK